MRVRARTRMRVRARCVGPAHVHGALVARRGRLRHTRLPHGRTAARWLLVRARNRVRARNSVTVRVRVRGRVRDRARVRVSVQVRARVRVRLLDAASGGAGRSVASILRSIRARLSASFWCFVVDASPRWLPRSTSARASENELSCVLACCGCRVLAWAARCFGMGCSFQDGQALWSPPSSLSPSRCWLCVSRTRSALRCCTAEARRRSAVVAALLRGEEEAPDRFSALRSGDGATELPLRWLYSVVRIANV